MSSLSRNFSPRAAVCSGGPGFYFRPQNLVQSRGLVWLKKKKKNTTWLSLQLPGPQEAHWWVWLVRKGKGRECSKSQAFLQLEPAGPTVVMDILEEKCWRLWVVLNVIEYLSSVSEALGLTPSTK